MDYTKERIEEEVVQPKPKPRDKNAELARRERKKRAVLRQLRYEREGVGQPKF
jgi:hypothetical protein